ncbi:ribonuclease R [Eubacteriales bacterium OttesenSCG-928-M02]|nr:ribonuclease R [Eubacteriales bacterium OttesenSCG-928-M02]
MELRENILHLLQEEGIPMGVAELAAALGVSDGALADALVELEKEAQILYTAKKKVALPRFMGYLAGEISASERGFGFLIPFDADYEDVFIPPGALLGAMHKDKVLVRVGNSRAYKGKKEGEVVRILSRARDSIVGKLEKNHQSAFVVPEDKRLPDVFIPPGKMEEAQNGDLVVAYIDKWPKKNRNSEGHVTEILGRAGNMNASILGIVRSYDLPDTFSDAVLQEAETIPQTVTKNAKKGREDFRHLPTITIDGSDAKDLDDAISLISLPEGGWQLYVHIADVSHYVKPNSPIDRDGYERATSVYFPNMVIPMLPQALSNGICSLNEGVERLALCCVMDLDETGNIYHYRFTNGLILVDKRCTYEAVNRILEKDEMVEGYQDIVPLLKEMERLSLLLTANRHARGSIDFDLPEAYIHTDAEGNTTGVEEAQRGIGNRMIEDFMLSANECAARFGKEAKLPMLYRIHEEPDEEKTQTFFLMLRALGMKAPRSGGNIHPKMLLGILENAADTPYASLVNRVMLRSMKKARYGELPIGHFGLALKNYCHFTSPIRRYPDLIVHRAIKMELSGGMEVKAQEDMAERMAAYGRHTSERERVAMEAERAVDDLLKAQYMEQYIGEGFTGIITSVLEFGIFVELPNTVEGLVRMASLDDDYYLYDEKLFRLTGRRTGKEYAIGDEMEIIVAGVNLDQRRVEFIPAQTEERPQQNKGKRRGRRSCRNGAEEKNHHHK